MLKEQKREKVILHEMTAQKILKLIKEQNLQQGDKLPTERALAQMLGISRTSLREALQNLEANGIIKIRHGSGIYVDVYDDSMLNLYGEIHQNNYKDVLITVHQMMEARMMTEIYCIRRLAETITPQQLDQLRGHEQEEYERLYFRNGVVAAPGLDFEQLLVSFLGNPVLTNIHKRLNSSWKSYLSILNAVVLSPDRRHKDHNLIIRALEDHNAAKAEKAITSHLVKSEKTIHLLLKQYEAIEDNDEEEASEESIYD